MKRSRKAVAATAAVVMFSGSGLVVGTTPAGAADACQHFSHDHYHFPYAHYDYWHYHGYYDSHSHVHVYHNHNHGNYSEKVC